MRGLALAVSIVLHARALHAQPADVEPPVVAASAAKDALDHGRFEEALTLFTRAFAEHPDSGTAAGAGEAAAKLGRHREAAEHFAIAISLLQKGGDEERSRLQALLKAEKAYVATVVVKLQNEGEAVLLVDRVAVASLPLERPIYLAPGEHEFGAEARGRRFVPVAAKVEAGSAVTLELREAPAKKEAAAPDKPVWPAIVSGVLAGTALVAGIATLAASLSIEADVEEAALSIDNCDPDALSAACQNLASMLSDRNATRNGSTIAFVVSGVLLGSTLGYLFIPLPAETEAVKSARVGPWFSGAGAGLGFSGVFR